MSSSGFINYNKESGISSAAAVSFVKRLSGIPCGHMGTLDPLASGVLPVAVGNASRLFNYLLDKQKVYRAVFRFGTETDTLDCTGETLQSGLPVPSQEAVCAALPAFIGDIEQVPPQYSAKSVGGVRAYKLARQGVKAELAPKAVRIDFIDCVRQVSDDSFEFLIGCGGGTYIRSLARDIAARCGTCAVMTSLIREKSGVFCIENSVTRARLQEEGWEKFLIPPQDAFSMPELFYEGREAERLMQGQRLACGQPEGEYKLFLVGGFYGIAEVKDCCVRARVKLI